MRWIKASEQLPVANDPDSLFGVTFRRISDKSPIAHHEIYRMSHDCIIMEYRSGFDTHVWLTDIEWLEETLNKQSETENEI